MEREDKVKNGPKDDPNFSKNAKHTQVAAPEAPQNAPTPQKQVPATAPGPVEAPSEDGAKQNTSPGRSNPGEPAHAKLAQHDGEVFHSALPRDTPSPNRSEDSPSDTAEGAVRALGRPEWEDIHYFEYMDFNQNAPVNHEKPGDFDNDIQQINSQEAKAEASSKDPK